MNTTAAIPAARPHRSRTRRRRAGATAATLAGLVFVVTACSAGMPGGATASPTPASATGQLTQGIGGGSPAFVQCMRSHGMPNFPSDGRITPGSGVDPGSSPFQDALNACKSLAPREWVDSGPVGAKKGGS